MSATPQGNPAGQPRRANSPRRLRFARRPGRHSGPSVCRWRRAFSWASEQHAWPHCAPPRIGGHPQGGSGDVHSMGANTVSEAEFVNVHGAPINPYHTPSALSPKPPKAKREAPAEWHKGWAVEGFAPGRIAEAEAIANAAVDEWQALGDAARAEVLKEGRRPPKPWSREDYIRTAKRTRVRTQPFEVVGAADEMAELARRSGWEEVRVVELAKRKA